MSIYKTYFSIVNITDTKLIQDSNVKKYRQSNKYPR